jgi:hypothetical protein
MYLGQYGEPIGWYSISGADPVGDMVIPTGFRFEEHLAALYPGEVQVLRKRVEAEVTSVSAVSPTVDLIPVPAGRAMVIDMRVSGPLFGTITNRPSRPLIGRPPAYLNPTPGKWPTVEEARKLVAAQPSK